MLSVGIAGRARSTLLTAALAPGAGSAKRTLDAPPLYVAMRPGLFRSVRALRAPLRRLRGVERPTFLEAGSRLRYGQDYRREVGLAFKVGQST